MRVEQMVGNTRVGRVGEARGMIGQRMEGDAREG